MKTTYKAISSNSLIEFNHRCNEAVQQGFIPLAGISVTYADPYIVYMQTFMYYEKVKE